MPRALVDEVRMNLASRIPEHLVDELLKAHEKIKQNFLLGRHEPAELNAGKFCEIVLRILQQEAYASHTALDKEVKNLAEEFRKFENATGAIDSAIPREFVTVRTADGVETWGILYTPAQGRASSAVHIMHQRGDMSRHLIRTSEDLLQLLA